MATLDELETLIDSDRARATTGAAPINVETPFQRGVAAVGGGALGVGDVLTFGLLGNLVAGGAALPDVVSGVPFSEAFAQRKAETAAMKDFYRQQAEDVASVGGVPITELGAGFTGVKGLPTLARVGSAALSYSDPLVAVDVPEEERLARAGVGLATGLGLTAAGRAIGAGGRLVGALGRRGIQDEATREVVGLMSPEERLRLSERIAAGEAVSEFGPRSAAEIAESPALALRQSTLTPSAARPLETAAIAREEAQKEALTGVATIPGKGETEQAIRNIAESRREEILAAERKAAAVAKADEPELLGTIGDELRRAVGELPRPSESVRTVGEETQKAIKAARNTAKEEARALWKDKDVYNVRANVGEFGQDVLNIVQNFKRTPGQAIVDTNLNKQIERLKSVLLPKQAVTAKRVKGTITPTRVSLGFLHDVQSELGDIVRKIKPGEATQDQALALQVHQAIQNIIENTPGTEKLGRAKEAWRNYFDTFIYDREKQRTSPLKTILRKSEEKVPGSLLSESFNYDAMRKAGIDTTQIDRQAMAEFADLPTAQAKLNWIAKNRPVLSSSPVWQNIERNEQPLKDIVAKKSEKFGAGLVDEVRANPKALESKTPAAQYAAREALFAQLQQMSKEELQSNQSLIRTVFKEDAPKVIEYANALAEGQNLSKYAKITDSMIPNNVFRTEKTARDFMAQFAGTDAEKLIQGRYVDNLKIFGKQSFERLKKEEPIARVILQDKYPLFEKIVKDIDDAKIVGRLEQGKTINSLTQKRLTALGWLESRRGVLNTLSKAGTKLGATTGILSKSFVGLLGGSLVGGWLEKFAQKRLDEMDLMVGKLLADPTAIDLAAAAPTKGNIEALLTYLGSKGYLAQRFAAGERESPLMSAVTGESSPGRSVSEEELLRDLELLGGQKKNNKMSNSGIPTGDKYAPEQLVRAVMQVESGGRQSAVSPKGARGKMQLMPATARELGVDPNDPVQNVEGGSRYLKQQLDTFGDTNLALAAYNMGPGALRKAIEAAGTSDWDTLVRELGERSRYNPDGLPLETINYVRKVNQLLA